MLSKIFNIFNKYNYIIVLFIIPTILIVLWFRDANILGTGESGLPFYDLILQSKNFSHAWANYALGHPTNITIASAPTYWFLAQLQNIGVPPFLLQAFFLWFSITVSGIFIYLLTIELFPKLDQKIYLLAPLFYWFNPFSMVNIWNRFLNNFFLFYAFLPLVLFLFIKGIRTKKYIYSILIGLSSLIFSYTASSITINLLVWLVFFYITFFYSVFYEQGSKLFVVKFFLITLSFWIFVNFWWISQVLSYVGLGSFSAVASSSFTTDSNYNTFLILSQNLGNLVDIIRLKHASFFADAENLKWVSFYQFPLVTFFEFLIAGLCVLPIVVRRKQREVLFLGSLFVFSLFFVKGNNPPLGEIFDQAFTKFSFLQLFRNPFEKIGFILALSATPLFCLGVSILTGKFATKRGKTIYIVLLFWLVFVWGRPFWTNFVFTSAAVPTKKVDIGYKVSVPKFYEDTSDWLLKQGNNFRLVVFPIGGEGITYTWPKGYSGVELSNQILPIPSISFNTNIPYYNEVSRDLEEIFLTGSNFSKVMDILNARYIVVRSDIDWKSRNMRDPQAIQREVQSKEMDGGLKMVNQFDNINLWENSGWVDHAVYIPQGVIKVSGSPKIEDILNSEKNQDLAIYSGENLKEDKLIQSEIIRPAVEFGLGSERVTDINISDGYMFPAVRILPSEYLYPAILLKEKIEKSLIKDRNAIILKKLSLLGKRLNEAVIEAEKGQLNGVETALNLYKQQLSGLLTDLSDLSRIEGDFFLLQEDVYKIFLKHFERIERINNALPQDRKEEIINVEASLRKELVDKKIIPYFGYLNKTDFPIKGRKVFQFEIEKEAKYELLLDSKSWNKYFKISMDEPFMLQVDKAIVLRKGKTFNEKYVSYGFFDLTPGKHEISWNTPDIINLVDTPAQLGLQVDHGIAEKVFPIKNFDPYSEYVLKFDYFLRKGNGLEAIIEQNNDGFRKDKIEPRYDKFLGADTYNFYTKNLTAYFVPSSTADSANLIFRIKPWNNCTDVFRIKGPEKCLNEDLRKQYDRTTDVSVSNISFEKTITEVPILRKEATANSNITIPIINYQKINNSEYKVQIDEAKEPFVLVLSQLFDPAWKIYIDGKETGKVHFLANAYANGWIIDKSGSYDLTVKFTPQDLLEKGKIVSLAATLAGLILVIWKLRKNNDEQD